MVPSLILGPTVQAQSIQSSQFRQYQALNSTIERALKAVMSGRFDEAKAILKPSLEKVPDHFEAHYLMALMAYEARDFAGNLAGLEIAEWTLGNLDRAYREHEAQSFLRGNALLRLGRREEARNAYRKAVEMDAGHANAWNNLVALSLGAKDMAGAKADIAKAEAAGARIRPELKRAVGDLP